MSAPIDFQAVGSAALAHAFELVPRFLPSGTREGNEWISCNPKRDDANPGSFKINLLTGNWADFATDDRGSDLPSLAAFLFDLSQSEAAGYLAYAIGDKVSGVEPAAHLAQEFGPVEGEPGVLMDQPDDKGCIQPSDTGPSDSFLRGSKYGRVPDHQWHYRDRTNRVVLTVCRFETPQGKSILQCTPWAQADFNVAWKWRGLPAERPLYDLPALP